MRFAVHLLYHGWLFAADGTVLETPNIPNPDFRVRFKTKAYPVREAGGIIWTHIGEPSAMPEFYDFPFLKASESKRLATVQVIGCNYVQVLEGLLDSSHLKALSRKTQ